MIFTDPDLGSYSGLLLAKLWHLFFLSDLVEQLQDPVLGPLFQVWQVPAGVPTPYLEGHPLLPAST